MAGGGWSFKLEPFLSQRFGEVVIYRHADGGGSVVAHPEAPLEMLFYVVIIVLGNNYRETESDDDVQKLFILMKSSARTC